MLHLYYILQQWLDGRRWRRTSNLYGFSKLEVPADAPTLCSHYDIIPENGRLVIFDSKLVHSVERVNRDKRRRPLTLWILRLEESGASGDVYYFGKMNTKISVKKPLQCSHSCSAAIYLLRHSLPSMPSHTVVNRCIWEHTTGIQTTLSYMISWRQEGNNCDK